MRPLLDDPAALHRQREIMHAPWLVTGDSPWVRLLDGAWSFHLAARPEEAPIGSELPTFDDTGWNLLPVPSNWELHGFGEPYYQNIAYPFVPTAYPAGPDANPTGCYRTQFDLPQAWDGRRVYIEFGAVEAAFHVWVNGREVGFSTDSKLPAHFELTAHLKPGRNHLAVRVYRWPAASYLEKQDYWHLSGIQRSVRLMAKPQVHLRDWSHAVHFDATWRDATVQARAWISQPPGPLGIQGAGLVLYPSVQGWQVAFRLRDPGGKVVAETRSPVADSSPMYGVEASGFHVEALSARAKLAVPAAQAWTAETPTLYTLDLELFDPEGRSCDTDSLRIGLRQVAIVDGTIRLNGQRLVLRGVNRHEFHPERGRALTIADMREDLLGMKRLHFNAVRTCHYPDADGWYALCDELGMYVIDEANLETHGLAAIASRDPQWAPAYLERAIRMCLRDRNYACIITWSLGNESAYGAHHAAMANWLRIADPTRPVQYESGFPGPLISDIMAPMYPSLDWVRQTLADPAERRPLVMCEYAYAKGNSTGNVRKFWDLIYQLPRFQGGFVWDWRDKALARRQADGRMRLVYGEPRFEPQDTHRMCLNGVVGADLEPHPGAWELAWAQCPVQVCAGDPARGHVRLLNRHQFIDLSDFRLRWEMADDGVSCSSGCLDCPAVPAGGEAAMVLPVLQYPRRPGTERHLTVTVERTTASAWAAAGAPFASFQFELPAILAPLISLEPIVHSVSASGALAINGSRLSGERFQMQLGADGLIAGLTVDGRELLTRPIAPCLSRAPTDIDLAIGGNGYGGQWAACGLDRAEWQSVGYEVVRLDAGRALIRNCGNLSTPGLPSVAQITLEITVHSTGEMLVDLTCKSDAAVETLARIGLETALVGSERHVEWFGRGPHENYPDRRDSALVGRYAAAVNDFLTPYQFPQECGLRCDVRWLAVTDATGSGLFVQGQPLLHASALTVRRSDLRDATHLAELVRRNETSIHLDGFHAGLGGDTGWTRNIHPEFRLPPGTYRCRFRLRPLYSGDLPAEQVSHVSSSMSMT